MINVLLNNKYQSIKKYCFIQLTINLYMYALGLLFIKKKI